MNSTTSQTNPQSSSNHSKDSFHSMPVKLALMVLLFMGITALGANAQLTLAQQEDVAGPAKNEPVSTLDVIGPGELTLFSYRVRQGTPVQMRYKLKVGQELKIYLMTSSGYVIAQNVSYFEEGYAEMMFSTAQLEPGMAYAINLSESVTGNEARVEFKVAK